MRQVRRRATRDGTLAYAHVELQRQGLRGEAGVIAASLVVKLTTYRKPARHGSFGASEERLDGEFLRVDVQLLFESKWKAQIFARRIGDPAGHDVTGRHQLDGGGNQQI